MIIASKVNFGGSGVVFKSDIVMLCDKWGIHYEYDEIGNTGVLVAVFLDIDSDHGVYLDLISMLERQVFEAK